MQSAYIIRGLKFNYAVLECGGWGGILNSRQHCNSCILMMTTEFSLSSFLQFKSANVSKAVVH